MPNIIFLAHNYYNKFVFVKFVCCVKWFDKIDTCLHRGDWIKVACANIINCLATICRYICIFFVLSLGFDTFSCIACMPSRNPCVCADRIENKSKQVFAIWWSMPSREEKKIMSITCLPYFDYVCLVRTKFYHIWCMNLFFFRHFLQR